MRHAGAIALGLILSNGCSTAQAAPPDPAVTEINYLLDFIDRSGCKFYRNGSWYDAHAAHSHLRRKYDYLAAHNRIKTADDFIDQAATKSSMSGEAYQIQCDSAPALPSNRWLHTALTDYREFTSRRPVPKRQRS